MCLKLWPNGDLMGSLYYLCLMLAAQVKPGGGAAEAAGSAPAGDGGAGAAGGGGMFDGLGIFLPAMLMLMVLYFVLMLPQQQKKEQAKVSEMLEGLKKNDEIITAGGIRGTVVNIQDGEYLTIRIDEKTNAKMQILKKSVIKILTGEEESTE